MFSGCTALTSFSSDISSLTEGYYMFYNCPNLTSFNGDLSSLTKGDNMFYRCTALTSFNSDLPSLWDGEYMFYGCENLSSWNIDLPNLMNSRAMFSGCSFTTFSSDLSSMTDGSYMFQYCSNLTSVNTDLSNVTNGTWMFYGCIALTAFTLDLSSVTNGTSMFDECRSLTSFSSELSSLTDGKLMFYNCKLDAPSVKNIINTINTYSAKLTLGMGCDATVADKDLFAQEVGYADMASLLAALQAKGWTVTAQYNGRPTTTYSMRRPSEDTLPVFVKLEEVEEHTNYTLEDGSKKYRLNYFHETTGSTDGYTQFNSLEEAIETLNIKTIENQ